jgi:hypothetical protein
LATTTDKFNFGTNRPACEGRAIFIKNGGHLARRAIIGKSNLSIKTDVDYCKDSDFSPFHQN